MSEWINIEDKLPPLGQFVIVTDGHHVGEAIYAGQKKCTFNFLILNHNVVQPWQEVSHWMELPQPPKGKECIN